MLIGWDGLVDEIDGAIRARSPKNPDFIFGNFLLFSDAPRGGEALEWVARCATALQGDPRVKHVCLRWDRPDGERGDLEDLLAANFTVEETIVMQTSNPCPPRRLNKEVTMRRIESDADWAAVSSLQAATLTEQYGPDAAVYARAQMARYREFVHAGRGAWLGAFANGDLVADMGVFVHDGLARFQAVETALAFRRRGLCGTLAHYTANVALHELGAETLVMVGLPDHTAEIYASVGFVPCERLVAAFRSGDQSA